MKQIGVIKFGGLMLIISGILFLIQYLFLMPMPNPPVADADLLAWLQEWRFNIAMADEVFFSAWFVILGIRMLGKVEEPDE